ncbi:MAG: 5-guanidino-2-oxopentanoate decarboxylase [Pseudomonadota bacterium]
MLSCGELLVRLLDDYSVDTVFGLPGNHTVQLYRGLADSAIRHVSPRHEQGAAFMADGYARACGRPGVCFLISGPGLTNAATAMMQALADSIPMLVITAVSERRHLGLGEGRLHELPDQQALASQLTRFSHTLMDPRDLPKVLARAFAVFTSQRPGPVHIELPLDVITEPADVADRQSWAVPSPPGPDKASLMMAASMLQQSKRPALVLGGGAVGASSAAIAIAETLDAPVFNTVNGKGVVPASHPLAVGASPSLPVVRDAISTSDVVLALGTEWGETDYDMLFLGDIVLQGSLIRVDIDAAQMARNQRPELAVVSDAHQFLEALLPLMTPSDRGGMRRSQALRAAVQADAHVHAEMAALFRTLQESVSDLMLVGDSTLPTYYAVWQYECEQPRRYFHSATGGGTLGYAIPASFGAKLAAPELSVAALIGDGSAQFTLPELAAGVELGLSVAVVVWNNGGYGEIRNGMLAAEIEPVGVDIYTPDLIRAAAALGCHTATPQDLEELAAVLHSAFARDRPTVIELQEARFLSMPAGDWY